MGKGKLFTLCMFMLTFGVVFGGWHLTKILLEQRREEFFGRTGEIPMQPSQAALLSAGAPKDAEGDAAFQGEELPEDMMAKVLAAWQSGGREIPHEPRGGQMNMEQAIEAGQKWIGDMAGQGIFPPEMNVAEFDHISATLCTLDTQVDFDENLVSYWHMLFIADDVAVNLTIHAVSGDVWRAEIVMDGQGGASGAYEPENLLEAAFPFIGEGDEIIVSLKNNTVGQPLPQGKVYAFVRELSLMGSGGKPGVHIAFWLENS